MALTKFDEARENCKIDKNNIIYYYIKLVKCKLRYNDIPSALSNKAKLNIVPNVVVELKAIIRIEQGKYVKAFDVIQKGLGKYPNDIGLLTQKIICYYYLKKYNQCINEGEQALLNISTLQIKQKLNIHLYIGYSLLCVKEVKKAEGYFEWYEQIEKSSGKKDEYYINNAKICIQFKLGDWRKVIDKLDKVLERNPNNITAIVTKFETYMKFNKKELGKEYYEKIKHLLNIENKEAINNLFNEEEECQMKSIQSTITNYDRKLYTPNRVEMSINLNQKTIKNNHHQSIRLCSSLSDPNNPDSSLDSSIDNSNSISNSNLTNFKNDNYNNDQFNKHIGNTVVNVSNNYKNEKKVESQTLSQIKKKILLNINHQNIYNDLTQKNNQNVPYESLYSLIEVNGHILLSQFKHNIIYGIANALAYLHKNDIVHCSVNTKFILIDFSMKFDTETYPRALLRIFSSIGNNDNDEEYKKEYALTDKEEEDYYIFNIDVYSFGVLIYKILTNGASFTKYKGRIINIKQKGFELPEIDKKAAYRNEFIDIIKDCCFIDRALKPKMDNVVKALEFLIKDQ